MIRGQRRLVTTSAAAGRALAAAAQIAHRSGKEEIDPDEVLQALIAESGPAGRVLRSLGIVDSPLVQIGALATGQDTDADSLDAAALDSIGVDLSAIEAQAESEFGPDALRRSTPPTMAPTKFSARGLRVLETARKEAKRLGDVKVEPEHLLIGISATKGGNAWTILRAASGHSDLRTAILKERS